MAVTGVANLAVKVADLDATIGFYERAGAEVRDRQHWRNGERVDVSLGPLAITFFTQAIYEDDVELPAEGFLHVALFSDDLEAQVDGHDVVWGPEIVSGAFGTRRIVFVDAPGAMRLEFMEQLADPPPEGGADTSGRSSDLAALGSATLGESGATPLARRLRAAWPGATVAAPCSTVRCQPGDNLTIHAAVAEAPQGTVLAVEVPSGRERGFWGEVLTTAAQSRGLVGLVIDACVRDTDALAARGFPVFSTGVALPGATKHEPGSLGGPVSVGEVLIDDGDWLVADSDGIVSIAAERLDDVMSAGRARAAKEATMFDQLSAGATTVELLDLDTSAVERSR